MARSFDIMKIRRKDGWRTMGMALGVFCLVCLTPNAPGSAQKWEVEWTPDNLPQESHPSWQFFGGSQVEVKGDVLSIDSDVESSTAGFRLISDEAVWNPKSAKAIEMEACLRVISQSGSYANLLNLWGFGTAGDKYWSIKFMDTGIQVNAGPVVPCDTSVFAVYRISATADRLEIFEGAAKEPLLTSDSPLTSEDDPGGEGLSTIDFGDTSGTAGGNVEWKFLRWRAER